MNQTYASPFKVALAPMEGVTDFATRSWFHFISSPPQMSTPFLRVTPTYQYRSVPDAFAPELRDTQRKYVLVPQLMTATPDDFLRIAEPLIQEPHGPGFIEINCGCPSSKVVGNGSGSSLLKNVETFAAFIQFITDRLGPNRLALKMRTGFNAETEFPALICAIKALPLNRLTVHGRTRPQRYTGRAQWDLIQHAVDACPFPVWGSGDINSLAIHTETRKKYPRLAGTLFGRGALRNPWIFRELRDGQATILSPEELVAALTKYAELQSIRPLPRLKMIWNYMRSSMPEALFTCPALRCSSLEDFFATVLKASPAEIAVTHHPDRDWMYSGESKAVVE